jgi:hypothetical protein
MPPQPTPANKGFWAEPGRLKQVIAFLLSFIALAMLGWKWRVPIADYFLESPDTIEPRVAATLKGPAANAAPLDLSSPREDQERARFMKLLAAQRADVLVVPPAALTASSLDQTARALIAFRLSQAIAGRTALTVADPWLALRALGERRRRHAPDDIARLAGAVGARLVITGEIVRLAPVDDASRSFDLALAVRESGKTQTVRIDNIVFSDALPPEEAFRERLGEALERLPLGTLEEPKPGDERPLDDALPLIPKALVSGDESPALARAYALQLFALFQGPRSSDAMGLWQRSVLALDQAAENAPHARLLRARAGFYLGRPPQARSLLAQPASIPERALRAIVDGNAPEAESATDAIAEPALRLAAEIELAHLQARYSRTGDAARYQRQLEAAPNYAPFLKLRLYEHKWFNDEVHHLLADTMAKEGLDPYPWQYKLLGWGSAIHGAFRYLALLMDTEYMQIRAIDRACLDLWKTQGPAWVSTHSLAALNESDYFDTIAALNRATVIKRLRGMLHKQARGEAAYKSASKATQNLAMDSDLAYIQAAALYDVEYKENNVDSNSRKFRESHRLARDAYLWDGGERLFSPQLEWYQYRKPYVKYLDEPPAADRFWPLPNQDRFAATRDIPRAEIERRVQYNLRRLHYVQTDFSVVETLRADLAAIGRQEEFESVMRDAGNRFHGSQAREKFIASLARETGDIGLEMQSYREAITASPLTWENYFGLARALLRQGKPEDAQKAMLGFPLFAKPDGNPVAIGNDAFDGAWLLLKTGYPQLAMPLYRVSADIDTGSAAQMMSQTSLSLMAGDMKSAAGHLERELERYRQSHVAGYYIEQLFFLGESSTAWKSFDRWSRTMRNSGEPYWASIVGHRLLGHTEAQTLEFVEKWNRGTSDAGEGGVLRDSMAFMALYLDRPPRPESLEKIRKINSSHGDRSLVHIATGYDAFLKRDYPGVLRGWNQLHASMMNLSFRTKTSYGYTLPYFALAHAAAGSMASFLPVLDQYGTQLPGSFDYLLAKAVVAATAGDFDAARDFFWHAFVERPGTGARPIHTALQHLEILEAVYELTRDDRYRALIADQARRVALSWPAAFAYAFEAKYTSDAESRIAALAMALHLDRASAHIAHFSVADRAKARERLARHKPFAARVVPKG